MDQRPRPREFPGEAPRTELQRRLDEGYEEQALLKALYDEWQTPLMAYARRRMKDIRDAEEFVQRVFLKMYLNFHTLITFEPARVQAWVLKVAKNQLIDVLRHTERTGSEELEAEFKALERDLAWRAPSRGSDFEERVDTWVGVVEPLLTYLRTLTAKGSLRDVHLRVCWHEAVGGTQQQLAEQLGVDQSRISQLKSHVRQQVRFALYLCEILGLVRPPHREAEIRSHLDLFDLATNLTEKDRAVLRRAGGATRLDPVGQPVLSPKAAEEAIQRSPAGSVTLDELHDAESAYAAAIPNPTPHCINSPCAIHRA